MPIPENNICEENYCRSQGAKLRLTGNGSDVKCPICGKEYKEEILPSKGWNEPPDPWDEYDGFYGSGPIPKGWYAGKINASNFEREYYNTATGLHAYSSSLEDDFEDNPDD